MTTNDRPHRVARGLAVLLVLATIGGAAAPAAAGRRADRTPPVVTFTTEQGSVRVGAPADTDVTTIAGTAHDRRSRVRAVRVIYCEGYTTSGGGYECNGLPSSHIEGHDAELSCTGRRCTWSARVPMRPGSYLAFAAATDARGNERVEGPLTLTVA